MCVSNYVAMDLSANVLLAAGASPAMVRAPSLPFSARRRCDDD